MYTQDDTIRILKRTPFAELRMIVRNMNREKYSSYKTRAAVKRHGWTIEEYKDKLKESIKNG